MRKLTLSIAAMSLLLVLAAPALAAGDGEQVGKNLGNLLGGWSKSLYGGIAGLVALVFLLNRRFADLAIFMVAAVLVGGFVMAPGDISSTVRDIWHTIAG
jgi:putative copper export protein